jgi:hypothetical protein
MANNKIQIKRTSISGRLPNTTNSSNSSYIDVGELALNLTDGILYSSNGSSLITVGSNLLSANIVNLCITGGLYANGSLGVPTFVLTSNGSGIYWAAASGSSAPYTQFTANTNLYSFQSSMFDTTNGKIYAVLPSSPTQGIYVKVADGGGDKYSYPVTIVRNGMTINDSLNDLELDVPGFRVELVYTGTTWKVFS